MKAENVLAGCFLAVVARLSVSCRTTRHQASFHTWGNNKQKSQTSSNIHHRLPKFFFVWHFSLISVCLFCQRLCSPPSAASLPSISSAEQPSQRLIGLSLIYSQPPDSRMAQSPQPYICPIICLMLLQLSGRSTMFNCPICAEDKAASGSIDLLLSVKGSPTPQTPHPHLSPQSVWCWLQRPGYMELLKSLTSSCVWRRLTDDCPFHWFTITCFVQTSRSPPSTLQRVAIFSGNETRDGDQTERRRKNERANKDKRTITLPGFSSVLFYLL